ncbi:MAG: NPCBM/NEW2 domain-containing protein, partial [Bacteroidales bacterium]|nr:NPCBM/NEW2 domain-containing protein [Bacteroidales bacterium]
MKISFITLILMLSVSFVPASKLFYLNDIIDTHAGREAYIRLDGKEGRFTAYVSVDDHADELASVAFYVFTNKGVAFSSGVMHKGDAPHYVDVSLDGVSELCLVTDGNAYNHADWADAKITAHTAPVAVSGNTNEPRYILTPKSSPLPRINGAKITGASTGKPFLFTIAATGERPVSFQAEHLPTGLTLDRNTGVISGSCFNTGKYVVPVTVANSRGICRDTIEIVIGGDLALTPHMGWNSWYIHATGVTQDIMEKSAQAMYDEGLVNFGYTFVNIDDGWEVKAGSNDPVIGGQVRNPDGTIRANKNFPDMKKLTDYIHRLGLKAGLYSSPGRTTCGGYEGSFGHEAQDVTTFAEWGFDFLKYDWCSYANVVKSQELDELQKPYRLIGKLIRETNRDIILNMCQYGMGDVWKWGKEIGGQSWRTTGDIGDTRNLHASMFRIGFFQEQLKDYSGPGGWNDPDYLLFGNIYDWDKHEQRLSPYSPSEHYTCMTLWCMMSAPLIFSGDITNLDDFTRNILCNAEVIALNQDKAGKQGYSISNRDFVEIWKKELSDGTTAIAVFNKRPLQTTVTLDWKALGYDGIHNIRDLWRQIELGTTNNVNTFDIPRHGCVLLKMSAAQAQTIIKAPEHYPQPEITWRHPYHQTLMMKLFLSEIDAVKGEGKQIKMRDKGETRVVADFVQALDIIRKIDHLTAGIPKIVYLVGWQYGGHDSKYPAWGEVNPRLKRPQDETALESMKWLMQEAYRYNTTVSVHINMFDAYDDSPLWDTYVSNSIIARNIDGSLRQGEWGWPVSYTQEWNTGYAQKRIDDICTMLPLEKAGTIHIDAFHTWAPFTDDGSPISPYLGYTAEQETETQRKIFRYWAEKGIDVTSEGMRFLRLSAFEGLQPASWWYSPSAEEYMKLPASYYCGGTTNDTEGLLFGKSMHGEDLIRKDPQHLTGFLHQFCTQTLPWYYLNRLQRLEYIS